MKSFKSLISEMAQTHSRREQVKFQTNALERRIREASRRLLPVTGLKAALEQLRQTAEAEINSNDLFGRNGMRITSSGDNQESQPEGQDRPSGFIPIGFPRELK